MKKLRIYLPCAFIIATLSIAHGESITDPLRYFLASTDDERDSMTPDPKVVMKMDVDINGDGRKVVFLSTYGDRSGCYWTVYIPINDGYKEIRGTGKSGKLIWFNPNKLHVGFIDEIKSRGLATYSGTIREGFTVRVYWIAKEVLFEKEIGAVKVEEGEEKPPLLKKYFPDTETEKPTSYSLETLSVDDLKSKGYIIHTLNR